MFSVLILDNGTSTVNDIQFTANSINAQFNAIKEVFFISDSPHLVQGTTNLVVAGSIIDKIKAGIKASQYEYICLIEPGYQWQKSKLFNLSSYLKKFTIDFIFDSYDIFANPNPTNPAIDWWLHSDASSNLSLELDNLLDGIKVSQLTYPPISIITFRRLSFPDVDFFNSDTHVNYINFVLYLFIYSVCIYSNFRVLFSQNITYKGGELNNTTLTDGVGPNWHYQSMDMNSFIKFLFKKSRKNSILNRRLMSYAEANNIDFTENDFYSAPDLMQVPVITPLVEPDPTEVISVAMESGRTQDVLPSDTLIITFNNDLENSVVGSVGFGSVTFNNIVVVGKTIRAKVNAGLPENQTLSNVSVNGFSDVFSRPISFSNIAFSVSTAKLPIISTYNPTSGLTGRSRSVTLEYTFDQPLDTNVKGSVSLGYMGSVSYNFNSAEITFLSATKIKLVHNNFGYGSKYIGIRFLNFQTALGLNFSIKNDTYNFTIEPQPATSGGGSSGSSEK